VALKIKIGYNKVGT